MYEFLQRSFRVLIGYQEVLAQKRILKDLKEGESLKLKIFKNSQHNTTCILHINSSNRMILSIHDFTFLMTETKN